MDILAKEAARVDTALKQVDEQVIKTGSVDTGQLSL